MLESIRQYQGLGILLMLLLKLAFVTYLLVRPVDENIPIASIEEPQWPDAGDFELSPVYLSSNPVGIGEDAQKCQHKYLEFCDQNFHDVFVKITSAHELTPSDVRRIIDNSHLYAKALKDNPESMARLLMGMQDDETSYPSEQDAAYALLEMLTSDEKIALAQEIFSTQYGESRISGLKILEESINVNEDAVDVLASVVETELDSRTLAVALNLAKQVTGELNREIVRDALTSVIDSNLSAYATGEALLTKIALSPSFDDISDDVYGLISTFDDDYREYGLTAIEASLDFYHEEFEANAGWRDETLMRDAIYRVAQDTSAELALRNRAQDILETYF